MPVSRNALCSIYAFIAVAALIGTWGNNLAYAHLGFLGANLAFWRDTLTNPASRSITVDIFFLCLAAFIWMVLEARRLSMRGVWAYLLFGLIIAISVTVPIFLIHRERCLATREPAAPAGALRWYDWIGLAVIALAIVAYTTATLWRVE